MELTLLKSTLISLLRKAGFEVHRINSKIPHRPTMAGSLKKAIENGLKPATVIDVGAAYGTPILYYLFSDAKHLLIEPLVEHEANLKAITQSLSNASYIIAAAGSTSGEAIINVHPDLVGSSIYKEEEDSDVNGIERSVPLITIDEYCQEQQASGSYLIKIDTQGAEVDVLSGADRVLGDTDFVILEVSLFEFFKGGPQLYDCIAYMKDKGFVVYDIFDPQYRPLDGAMSQVDLAFVQENSLFRQYHYYATREQRQVQTKRFTKRGR